MTNTTSYFALGLQKMIKSILLIDLMRHGGESGFLLLFYIFSFILLPLFFSMYCEICLSSHLYRTITCHNWHQLMTPCINLIAFIPVQNGHPIKQPQLASLLGQQYSVGKVNI